MRALLTACAFGLGLGLAGAAAAQPTWNAIDQRRADLHQRIDVGVRDGQITRQEAALLREDFERLVELQQAYRANGLNAEERRELDRRFDALGERIRAERRDQEANASGRRMSIERRVSLIEQRIGNGERGGALSLDESSRLRADLRDIASLRARLEAGGLTVQERAQLDRRFDALDEKLQRSEVINYATVAARR